MIDNDPHLENKGASLRPGKDLSHLGGTANLVKEQREGMRHRHPNQGDSETGCEFAICTNKRISYENADADDERPHKGVNRNQPRELVDEFHSLPMPNPLTIVNLVVTFGCAFSQSFRLSCSK